MTITKTKRLIEEEIISIKLEGKQIADLRLYLVENNLLNILDCNVAIEAKYIPKNFFEGISKICGTDISVLVENKNFINMKICEGNIIVMKCSTTVSTKCDIRDYMEGVII